MGRAIRGGVAIMLATMCSSMANARHVDWPNIHEGLWEFTISYHMPGTMLRQTESYTDTRCISRNDPMPRIERSGQECTSVLQDHFGRSVSWQVNCSSQWEMVHGMGRMHYIDNTARGNVFMQIMGPIAPPQPMVFEINGRRLGDCEKGK